jgi:hypothetical protein
MKLIKRACPDRSKDLKIIKNILAKKETRV